MSKAYARVSLLMERSRLCQDAVWFSGQAPTCINAGSSSLSLFRPCLPMYLGPSSFRLSFLLLICFDYEVEVHVGFSANPSWATRLVRLFLHGCDVELESHRTKTTAYLRCSVP